MNKLYLLAPLAALLLFGAVYAQHHQKREAQRAAQKIQDEADRAAQHARDRAERELAQKNAVVQRELRLAERVAREQAEEARKQARTDAERRGQEAVARTSRLRTRFEKLRADLALVEIAAGRAEKDQRELTEEQRFLANYLREAEANRAGLFEFLEQVEALEKARAALPAAKPVARHD